MSEETTVREPSPPGNRWVEREAYSTGRGIVDESTETVVDWSPSSEPGRITDEAWRLVMGDRQSDYNHPSDDFKATGRQWGAVLTNWLHSERYALVEDVGELGIEEWEDVDQMPDVPPRIVALMMAQLKISRESHKPKHDNRVDAIGYVVCADRIVEGY